MHKWIALYICTISCLIYTEESPPQKIIYFTIPKGGSHLFRKAVGSLVKRPFMKTPSLQDASFPSYIDPSNPCILYHHFDLEFWPIFEDRSTRYIKMMMIRDPRDVIVSMAAWIEEMAETDRAREFIMLPLEDQITKLIIAPDLVMNGSHQFIFDTHAVLQCTVKWLEDPSVFICRFEDLVGSKGGGDDAKQIKTMKALAHHLHSDVSSEEIEEISSELFGETATFRSGQIGSWKEVFTPLHKELFKLYMGDMLIALGYEKDHSW